MPSAAVVIVVALLLSAMFLGFFGKEGTALTLLRIGDHVLNGEDDHTVVQARRPAKGSVHRAYLSPYLKKQIAYDQGWKCSCGCGASLQPDFHIDHTVPLWQGGSDNTDNMSAMNPQCHNRKTAMENQSA